MLVIELSWKHLNKQLLQRSTISRMISKQKYGALQKKEMSPNCPANVALIPTPLLDGLARSRMLLLHLDNRGFSFQFVPFVMGQSICYPMCSRTGSTEPKNTISQIKQYQESKDIFKLLEKTFFAGYFSQSFFLPPFCLFLFLRQGYL